MRRDTRLLTDPLFLAALALLVANDFLFKPLFHNALTGKLSDFAGLFVFPLFWAALFPRRRAGVYCATAAGFVFWKSPHAQPVIEWWNTLGLMRIERVVDATDLFALAALPPSWLYLRGRARRSAGAPPPPAAFGRRVLTCLAALLSVFAFTATQRAGDHMISEDREYEFRMTKETLLRRLSEDIGLGNVSHHRSDDEHVGGAENAPGRPRGEEGGSEVGFRTPTKFCDDTIYAAATLRRKGAGSVLKVRYLIYNCERASPEREREAVRVFERDVIEKLRALDGGPAPPGGGL